MADFVGVFAAMLARANTVNRVDETTAIERGDYEKDGLQHCGRCHEPVQVEVMGVKVWCRCGCCEGSKK